MTKKSVFGFKTPKESPGFLLWQTMTTWQRKIKSALQPLGISHSQFVIMALIKFHEESGKNPNQVQIINLSKLDKMTVSNALKDLVTKGLVIRTEDKTDTRAKCIQLTAAGHDSISQAVSAVEGVDQDYFSPLIPQERKTIIDLMNKLGG